MTIVGASYIGKPADNTVMYVTKKVEPLIHNLKESKGCLIFAEENIDVPDEITKDNTVIKTKTPQMDYARYVCNLDNSRRKQDQNRKYKFVNNEYYLGENTVIGEGSVIEKGCVIGHDVVIGCNAIIKSGSIIKNSVIGDNFIAGENSTIGTTGFTMTNDENNNKIRIPTLGKVRIGNNVEVGALSNVSCGSAGDTVLGDNVKIDSLVHIGHDVKAGKNVEIPAGAIVGGFAVIEDDVYIGINATIRNRITIGEGAFIGMGSVVTKSVEAGNTVVGNPAKKFK